MLSVKRLFNPRKWIKPLPLLFGFTLAHLFGNRKSECCGIIGVISNTNNAEVVVTQGIKLLQNRGYDSAGIASFSRSSATDPIQTHITKYAIQEQKNCIEKVVEEGLQNHKGSFIGIGHTRWATCGGKSSPNAHPHFDQTHNYFLVHNGTIVNYKQIKETYLKGKTFTSETDTQVIVQLLAKICDEEQLSVAQGLKKLQKIMIGQWGLVVMSKKNPEQINIATYGSPILIGFAENNVYVASETIAFQKYTKEYMETKNQEIFTLNVQNIGALKEQMAKNGRLLKASGEVKVKLQPDHPFTSFFEQEIHTQGQLKFKPYLTPLDSCSFQNNLTLLGCGSSFYASTFSVNFFKKLKAFKKVLVLDAAELLQQDIQQGESVILVSQSGQTKDLLGALEQTKKVDGVKTIGVINVVGSALARNVDCPIYTNVGREVAVAATKSFTHQILNLLAIAVRIAQNKGQTSSLGIQLKNQLSHIPDKLKQTIEMVKPACRQVASVLKDKKSLYLLAKGEALAIAKEGALKIKELCYIHAEAFGASQMKHGPLALIDYQQVKQTVVVFLIPQDKNLPALKVAIDELHSRKAYIVVITNCIEKLNKQKIDKFIEIPKLKILGSLLCLVPLQIITKDICACIGTNPDKPRNLAKTVTV